ncbi:S26 family signal peptidase [Halosimplex salinum]|uniref:S26 family signal peptidase n=1 Tax=Halosimplex salinum TaxID=1710538 RepID=UPI000F48880E|nr:S26 family signal peptidase [Halosimplex salinum]
MSPPRDDAPPSDDSGRADPPDRDTPEPDDPGRRDTADGTDPTRSEESPPGGGHEAESTGPEGDGATGGGDGVAVNGGEPTVRAPTERHAEDSSDDESALKTFVFDVVSSALAVVLVGVLLFAVSGVWPPMVAVESPSMTPNMQTGDLVFVMEEQRFPGDGAIAGTGVVTASTGETTDYRKFAKTGDVIVYKPDGREDTTPIIHRAMFWVDEGENWYDEANRQYVGNAGDCDALKNCPAPHAGFVTKGDANGVYDQSRGLSSPVKPSWVVGTAEVRVPKLGCIRLRNQGCAIGVQGAPATDAVAAGTGNRTALAP